MLEPLRLCVADLWVKSTCRERGHVREACTDLRESSAHPPVPGWARGSSTCSCQVKYTNRDGRANTAYHMVVASAIAVPARQGAYALATGGIRDREDVTGSTPLRGAVTFDVPLSREDSRLSQNLHRAVSSGMLQCHVEQLARPTLSKTTRAPSHRHGRPRRRSGGSGLTTASLWHSNRKR